MKILDKWLDRLFHSPTFWFMVAFVNCAALDSTEKYSIVFWLQLALTLVGVVLCVEMYEQKHTKTKEKGKL